MLREIGIGAGLAGLIYLMLSGYDLSSLFILGGIVSLLYFLQASSGVNGIGKRFSTLGVGEAVQGTSLVTFDDIGGQESAKRELTEALEFVKNIEVTRHLGIRPLKGILLTGPPGTGKTLLAKAAASYTDSVFVAASGSEFIEMYAGVGAQRVRQLFKKARTLARKCGKPGAVVFIDEIEVLGGKRGKHSSHMEYDQTLNQLLVEMDGIDSDGGVRVLVIGATNRADLLDPALMRPGRFDRIVRVDLPDRSGRLHILRIHARGKPLAPDVNLEEIARDAFGFSGAHLESLVNEAAILAMREGRDVIGKAEFKEAMDKVIMGEKLDRRPNNTELSRIAYHEAGHAIVSEKLRANSVSAVTVTSRGRALGYMRQSEEDDRYIYTGDYLEDQIAILLAGALAEELACGNRSTGAAADFEQALEQAHRMIASGMSRLGIVKLDELPRAVLYEATSQIISEQEKRVRTILEESRGALSEIASVLIEREKIEGDEMRAILAVSSQAVAALRQGQQAASRVAQSA